MPTVRLTEAPNPTRCQTAQGIILEVGTVDHVPRSLWTRYGRWEFVSTSEGTQKKAFQVLVNTLGLEKIPLLSNAESSYWHASTLPFPIMATPKTMIPYKEAQRGIEEFLRGSK